MTRTFGALAVRVEVGEDRAGGGPRSGNPRPDEADPLLLPDDLDLGVLLQVGLELLREVGCRRKKEIHG